MGEGPQANSNFAAASCGCSLDAGWVEDLGPDSSSGCGGGRAASVRAGAAKSMMVGPFSSSSTLRHVSVLPRPSRAILLLIGSFPCHSADATLDWTALDQWQASVCPGGGGEGHRRGNEAPAPGASCHIRPLCLHADRHSGTFGRLASPVCVRGAATSPRDRGAAAAMFDSWKSCTAAALALTGLSETAPGRRTSTGSPVVCCCQNEIARKML